MVIALSVLRVLVRAAGLRFKALNVCKRTERARILIISQYSPRAGIKTRSGKLGCKIGENSGRVSYLNKDLLTRREYCET